MNPRKFAAILSLTAWGLPFPSHFAQTEAASITTSSYTPGSDTVGRSWLSVKTQSGACSAFSRARSPARAGRLYEESLPKIVVYLINYKPVPLQVPQRQQLLKNFFRVGNNPKVSDNFFLLKLWHMIKRLAPLLFPSQSHAGSASQQDKVGVDLGLLHPATATSAPVGIPRTKRTLRSLSHQSQQTNAIRIRGGTKPLGWLREAKLSSPGPSYQLCLRDRGGGMWG